VGCDTSLIFIVLQKVAGNEIKDENFFKNDAILSAAIYSVMPNLFRHPA